jgi:20S proteasome alpha/beta subunit
MLDKAAYLCIREAGWRKSLLASGDNLVLLVREMQSLVKMRELRRPTPPNSVAKLMSVLLFERRLFPLITQVIIGGVDDNFTHNLS